MRLPVCGQQTHQQAGDTGRVAPRGALFDGSDTRERLGRGAHVLGHAQNLVDTMRYNANIYRFQSRELMPVKSAARLCSNILFNQRYFPYYVQIIMAGYTKSEGSNIYNIDLFGSMTTEKFISTGSGSPVAYGYLESEFKDNMSVNEAYKVAMQAIAAAIRRNAGTGDSINVVIIDKNGYREMSKEEKAAVGVVF